MVRYIRADETPHVDYLRTALTEIRDRTFVGESGSAVVGEDVIGTLWDSALEQSLGAQPRDFIRTATGEIEHALARHPRRDDILEGFVALGSEAGIGGGAMKFGIFYEHQLPRPWTDDSEYQLIQDALEQIELADALGIDYVWEVEHHFLEEYSHSSAPEVFLAAVSQRTKRIRLGHGIVQTPPAFNHPGADRGAGRTLDLVSGGRVDFGSGESSSEAELGGFMIDPDAEARDVGGGSARRGAVHDRDAVHRPLGRVRHDAAAQRRPQAACRSRTRRCGSRAAGATRSTSRRRRRSARSRSRSSTPRRRATGSTTTTTRSRPRASRSATR